MKPADWRDLIRLLVAGATHAGEIARASELVCALSVIDMQARVAAEGFAASLDLLSPQIVEIDEVEARR